MIEAGGGPTAPPAPGGADAPAVPVLFEDEAVLAVDKPAGRIVIRGRSTDEASLREELEARHGPLWVVHRLDRGTSGVLLFARTAEAHRRLNLAFDRGEPRKRYLALVRGDAPAEQRIELALAPARRGRMRPARPGDERGKRAATVVRRVEAFLPRPWSGGALALVEAFPETGRTHQIRVHLAAVGLPLAVDPDYGETAPLRGDDGRLLLGRTPLHAASIAVRHPLRGGVLAVEAPLPADLAAALEALRASA